MNDIDSWLRTADELVSFAKTQSCDIDFLCSNGTFGDDERYIILWRDDDGIHYNLQGRISILPAEFLESVDEFQGRYHEVGVVDTIEKAFAFVKMWLISKCEVVDLPERTISKQEID